MSIFRERVGSLVFLKTFLAAEEEFLSPVSDGEGLASGNITTADRVLDQFFFGTFRADGSPFGGEKRPFYHPVDDPYQYQNRNQTVHILVFPS